MADWDQRDRENENFGFFMTGIRAMWNIIADEQKNMKNILLWIFFVTALNLSVPWLYKVIFDDLQAVWQGETVDTNFIHLLISILFIRLGIIFLEKFALEKRFLTSVIRLENRVPQKALEKLTLLSLGYHEKENTGKKISKITKGCDRLIQVLCILRWGIMPQLFYLVLNIAFVMCFDWRLGLIFLIPFIPAVILNIKIEKKFGKLWEDWDKKKELSIGYFCQAVINIFSVKIFNQEKREQRRFGTIRKDMEDLDIDVSLRIQKYFFFIGALLNSFYTLTIVAWYLLATKNESSLGMIVMIITISSWAIQSLWGLIHDYLQILRNLVSVIRMDELLQEDIDIRNSPNAFVPNFFQGVFDFRSINFTYPGKEQAVFENFNLKFEPNKMYALVGRSGEGKTTIARLICRMYDIESGEINLDGNNIKGLDLSWYRRLFAVVQQDVDVFDATIRENIVYAYPDASDEQIAMAVKASYLETVVNDENRFPDGLETLVGERGVRLSGGERQRVGIARAFIALLNGAKVLILDEATSNLDSMAERAIQQMITDLRKEKQITILAIAHRLSTIQQADLIYVINNGRIIESGDHQKLMKRNGLYKELVELQKLGEIRE